MTKASYGDLIGTPILGKFLSLEEATTELERSLLPTAKLSSSIEAALKRLRNMLLLEHKDWGPDLVVKSFNDWDKVFFNRRLKRHVELCWRTEESVVSWVKGAKVVYGHQVRIPRSVELLNCHKGLSFMTRWIKGLPGAGLMPRLN